MLAIAGTGLPAGDGSTAAPAEIRELQSPARRPGFQQAGGASQNPGHRHLRRRRAAGPDGDGPGRVARWDRRVGTGQLSAGGAGRRDPGNGSGRRAFGRDRRAGGGLVRSRQDHLSAGCPAHHEQGGMFAGCLSRGSQGQERFQALPAGLRCRVRLSRASLRDVRPALQSSRPASKPDAGQAHPAGRPRRRIAVGAGLSLLQRHPGMDRAGGSLWRSQVGPGGGAGGPSGGDLHARPRAQPAGGRGGPLRGRIEPGRDPGIAPRQQQRGGGVRRGERGEGHP